ncbi:hypothetical protein [Halobacterium wangiae]|uniref:hypothetical protein n=1 Tax=Halobacterium wangiae TaxID=2902623 RepID=UPI001E61095E|nr:hypothetical protein [Halobacterium wangiae]
MVAIADIALLDFVLGSVAALGLLYLLYAETLVVHYQRFFRLITVGMLVYALTGPVIGTLAPAYIHLIHAAAALCITVGLWDLVQEDLRGEEDFRAIIAPGLGEQSNDPVDVTADPEDD